MIRFAYVKGHKCLALIIEKLLKAVRILCQMDGRVVYGARVEIGQFAHSAFLFIKLLESNFVCGSSIINQRILLTAAHCLEDCINSKCRSATAFVGHSHKYRGMKKPIKGFIIHEHYDHTFVENDIGLVAVKEDIVLGEFVQRVSIVNNFSNFKEAEVAGWGFINESQNTHTQYLHYAKQKIWSLEECRKIVNVAPNGTFCAGGDQYASEGDSGSALVVDNYIQIGIVSFKRPDITPSVVIYTNVTMFYSWIQENSRKLHCCSSN